MNIVRLLFIIGVVCLGLACILTFFFKWGFPFGKLPGDFSLKGEKYQLYFPVSSSILISILLTLILNIVLWLFRK